MQNAYIERKNGSLRRELLNAYLFSSLAEVRCKSEEWRIDYNTERPHKALGYLSPFMFKKRNMQGVALSTPSSGKPSKFAAQTVVDNADKTKEVNFENSNSNWH
jgi:hypothetical protein